MCRIKSRLSFLLSTLCVLFLLCACTSSPSHTNIDTTRTSTPRSISTIQKTALSPTSTPQVQTNCPASGTARTAIMPALTLGTHQNVVYAWNQDTNKPSANAILRRYDATSGSKSDIATFANADILIAQISTDGQWILFVTDFPDHEAIQLIRIDGQYLQTLYCHDGNYVISILQWSPNQKTIAIEENASSPTNNLIYTLDLAHGTFQLIANGILRLETWIDNTHLIASHPLVQADTHLKLYLVDIAKHEMPEQDLPVIWQSESNCYGVNNTSNPNVLYVNQCAVMVAGVRQPTIIQSIPVSGSLPSGWPQQIMVNEGDDDIVSIATLNQQNLLYTARSGLWSVSTDGSKNTKHLITLDYMQNGEAVFLSNFSESSWSNVSRDGTLYVVKILGMSSSTQSLDLGSVNGGNTSAFVQLDNDYNTSLIVAGWTTF